MVSEDDLQRRDFLKYAASGPLVAATVARADQPTGPEQREVDVVVVGAGLSGLTTARELRKHKTSVCVLEARDRVGGRTLDHAVGGGHVAEGGGQWIGPSQTAVLGLAKELGIETFETFAKGKAVIAIGGSRLTTAAGARDESADMKRVKDKLDSLAKEVPLDTPWTAKYAKEWDSTTLGDWLKSNAREKATREEITLEVETEMGPPSRTSLLWFLFYVHSAGGIKALNVNAQELRFKGGPQLLSKKMAAELKDDLVLSSPVKKIGYAGEKVIVESKRVVVFAKRAVVAMMPADAQRIEFNPPLPAARTGLVKGWTAEPAFKVNVVYPKPFWRGDGLSGLAISDHGPIGLTFDNSPPDGSKGVIVGFIDQERSPKDASKRKSAIIDELVMLLGKAAKEPTDYFETDWSSEAWTAGCVTPLPPGVLTKFGAALREPVGRIHWAGTETSEVWCGYMDGAVRSGQRVAAEVRKAM
jgi:monoamine oxidase